MVGKIKKDILALIVMLNALKLVFDRQRRKDTKLCQGWRCGLHCRGPGENVNTGCQPPLHERPGKIGVGVGWKQGSATWKKKQNFNKPSAVDQQQEELFITVPLKQEVGANPDALDLHHLLIFKWAEAS